MFKPLLIAFYGLSVLVHALVLARLIPFDWVNGGRSASYAEQARLSIVSIVVLAGLFSFVWFLAQKGTATPLQRWTLIGITVVVGVGLLLQLLGTAFERGIVTLIMIAGLTGHLLLLGELRRSR